MKYNQIVSAVFCFQRSLTKTFTEQNIVNIPKQCRECTKKVKSAQIYKYLISYTNQAPTSQSKWIEYYPFLEKADWQSIFTLVSKLTKHSLFATFQFKILHRIFNCNYKLFLWGIKSSPACSRCGLTDNLEHFFYYCHKVQNFWCEIQDWMASISIAVKFTVLEVLLGYIHYDKSLFHCVNYTVLMGKHFINISRDGKKTLCLSSFLHFLKSKLKIEKELLTSKQLQSLFNKRFGYIFSKLV